MTTPTNRKAALEHVKASAKALRDEYTDRAQFLDEGTPEGRMMRYIVDTVLDIANAVELLGAPERN